MQVEITYYFDYLPSRILERILQKDCYCGDESFLSQDAILHICGILAERQQLQKHGIKPDLKILREQMQRSYPPSNLSGNGL